jgi:3-hydroxy-9,10-secoandrosta-1,3,5(10)-triene-9,17-dione monooxygenase reductase component
MANLDEHRRHIGRAIGRIPSGVYIVSAVGEDGVRHGLLASWLQQAGFEPPALTVAVGKDRPMLSTIRARGVFGVSVLGEVDMGFMKKFARGVPPGQDAFEGTAVRETPKGLPVLAEALAGFECSVLNVLDHDGDHSIVLAQIDYAEQFKEGEPFKHVRGNGFHY